MSLRNTPFDDVFKTLLVKCSSLIIPVINEVFRTSYDITEKVQVLGNELFPEDDAGEFDKLVTDSYLRIRNKTYHVECQSTQDNIMVMRMVEYDFQHALSEAELFGGKITIQFPESVVLYLRHTRHTPDKLEVKMLLPQNKSVYYQIPVVKVKEYTKEDIIEKNLYFFVPYYILKYEKVLALLNEDEERIKRLTEDYQEIYNGLRQLENMRKVNSAYLHNIIQLTNTLIEIVAEKQEKLRKEVSVMGGKVLDLESDKIREEGKLSLITEFVKNGFDAQEACKIAKINYQDYCNYVKEPLCVREEFNYNADKKHEED